MTKNHDYHIRPYHTVSSLRLCPVVPQPGTLFPLRRCHLVGLGPLLGHATLPEDFSCCLCRALKQAASGDALFAAHTHVLTAPIHGLPYTATTSIRCLILPSTPYTGPEAKRCLFSHRGAVALFYIFKLKHLWCFDENQKQMSRICVWRTTCSWNGDPMLYFTTRSPNPLKRQIQTLSEIHSLSVWSTTCLLLKENTPETNFILKPLTISKQDKLILPKSVADGT